MNEELDFMVEDIASMSKVQVGALLLAYILNDHGGDMMRDSAAVEYNNLVGIYGTAQAALTARKRLN